MKRDYSRSYVFVDKSKRLPTTDNIQADTTTATLISRPLRVSHDTLGKVRSLESRFILLPTVISSFIEVLDGLELLSRSLLSSGSLAEDAQRQLDFRLDNARRQSRSFIRTAKFLQQRSNNTATLLADTLAFRNQGVSQEQNMRMLILTRSAVFITIITLVYLPWTLVTVCIVIGGVCSSTD
jgi:Mg2+ and Co2+ transporter CorA